MIADDLTREVGESRQRRAARVTDANVEHGRTVAGLYAQHKERRAAIILEFHRRADAAEPEQFEELCGG